MSRVYSVAGRKWLVSKVQYADSLEEIQKQYKSYGLSTAGFRKCTISPDEQKYKAFGQKFGFYFAADIPILRELYSEELKKLDSLIKDLDVFATERFLVTGGCKVPSRDEKIHYTQHKWPRLAPILEKFDMKITKADKILTMGGAIHPRKIVYNTFIKYDDLKKFEPYSKEQAAEIIERKGRELGNLYDESAFSGKRVVTLDEHVEMGRMPVPGLVIFRQKNGVYGVIESTPVDPNVAK